MTHTTRRPPTEVGSPRRRWTRASIAATIVGVVLSGCGFTPYDIPLPGGADLGDDPYDVTIEFEDALDLVPQSGVRVNDLPVGRVDRIELSDDGWTAMVTVRINGDVRLPANTVATIRQTSLLGEKFVSLDPPEINAAGTLEDGAHITLENSGRNPEVEEVLAAASLLLNGGGLERTRTIVQELNATLGGRSEDVSSLIAEADSILGELDDNSDIIVQTLEQVNDVARTVNDRTDTFEAALDELPDALTVLDDQRGDIIALLDSLDELSGVATEVIEASRDDLIANLEDITPTISALADTGDDLVLAVSGITAFPFTDEFVGGTLQGAQDTHMGDYANLSMRLEISQQNLEQLLGIELGILNVLDLSDIRGVLEEAFGGLFGDDEDEAVEPESALDGMERVPGSDDLLELNEGPGPRSSEGSPAPAPESGGDEEAPRSDGGSGSDLCGLLTDLCRPPVGGQ